MEYKLEKLILKANKFQPFLFLLCTISIKKKIVCKLYLPKSNINKLPLNNHTIDVIYIFSKKRVAKR